MAAVRPYAHLYGSRWRKARGAFLAKHPLCAMCHQDGKLEPAAVVDHIRPHKGDARLFWDRSNWQSLCATHHSATKQRQEASGHAPGHDATGMPTDPAHLWVRAAAGTVEADPPPMGGQSSSSAERTSVWPLCFPAVNRD